MSLLCYKHICFTCLSNYIHSKYYNHFTCNDIMTTSLLNDLIKDKNGIDDTYGNVQPAAILERAQRQGKHP